MTPRADVGDSECDRVHEFDYEAERLVRTYDRIFAAEPIALELGEDMSTAWGLAYAVTHHARTVLNASTTENWDLDSINEDDCPRRTALIFNGWQVSRSSLRAASSSPDAWIRAACAGVTSSGVFQI